LPEEAMMSQSRRALLINIAMSASAVAACRLAFAQGTASLSEDDAQAKALGYKSDATKVDQAKFPKYAAGQICGGCQFYQGKPADVTGPCSVFPNKLVAAKGWCSTWVKKT
jgi:High potential iron-sulfur protein